MHYFIENIKSSKKNIFFSAQAGVSSLLFIVLVGLSLTVLTVGYMSSMRNLQSSAITTHAQTQAQMQAMIGYHALTEYLNKLSKESNGLQKIDQVCDGEIKETDKDAQIIFERVGACNNSVVGQQFIFDVTGKSGGATTILRTLFKVTDTVTTSTVTGSVFASGLNVFGHAEFSGIVGDNVTIAIGGAKPGEITGGGTVSNITVKPYLDKINVPDAMSLKSQANYIFELDAKTKEAKCSVNNLNSGATDICNIKKVEDIPGVLFKGDVWHFDSSVAKLAGIIWFDGDVNLTMKPKNDQIQNNIYIKNDDIVNTVVATGNITSVQPNGNQGGKQFHAYAPYHYLLEANDTNILARLDKVCPANNYPTQYCQTYDANERAKITSKAYFDTNKNLFIKDVNIYPASLANMLLLTDTGFEFNSSPGAPMFLYGNMIGSKGAGGTGSASGKFVGNANINVFGNIIVTGEQVTNMTPTEVGGNANVILGKSKGGGNSIPTTVQSFIPASIAYQ